MLCSPGYYTCDNNQVKNKGAQRECFKCCRSACIVDEFANGVKKAGFTYKYCDKSCWQYCGYTSARGRMLLSLAEDAVANDFQVQPPPAETNWRGSV